LQLYFIPFWGSLLPSIFSEDSSVHLENSMLATKDGISAGLDPSSKLRKALQEGRANTELMIKKLQAFEEQLDGIESDLRPLQDGTQKYTVAKENISKTLLECGKTYEYFRIASEVKPIANAIYSREKAKDIYDALERLSKAKAFFEKHREMRSSAGMLNGVDSMMTTLEDKCVHEVVRQMVKLGSTVVTRPGGAGELDHYTVTNPLSESALRDLQGITEVLDGLGLVKHIEQCGELRLKQVHLEMKAQEESRSKCWKKLLDEDFPFLIRNNTPLQQYLAYASEALRGEMQLWGVLFATSPASVRIFLDTCHAVIDEIKGRIYPFMEDSIYNIQSKQVHKNNVFLIRLDMLDSFMTYYHSMYEVCKPDFRKESSASLALTAIRDKLVYACIAGIQELLRSSNDTGPTLDPSYDAAVAKKDARNGNRHDMELFSVANAGEKCDLQPVTNDTLHCCGQLLQYGKFFIAKLSALARDINVEMPLEAKNHSSLIYALLQNMKANFKERSDVIGAAVVAMNSAAHAQGASGAGGLSLIGSINPMSLFDFSAAKEGSKLDRDTATHKLYELGNKEAEISVMGGCPHLFLSNNFSKLQEFLMQNMTELQQCVSPKLLDAYCLQVHDIIVSSRKVFCEMIGRTLAMLPEDILVFESKYKSTSDKTALGRLVKAKFSTFNSGLEALLAQQGAWRVSSATLRDELGKQMADTIVPAYAAFYDKYSKTNFSKRHMDQYIRFTAEDAKLILGRFFGGGSKK